MEIEYTTNGTTESNRMYEAFAHDLVSFPKTGQTPHGGDRDVNYCLGLQMDRLSKRGLTLEYDLKFKETEPDAREARFRWADRHYVSTMEFHPVRLKRCFLRNGKLIYKKKQNYLLYQVITDFLQPSAAADDLHNCPNCGAVSTLRTLEQGCPYCKTFFKMKDLFPRVTNYFWAEDFIGTNREANTELRSVMLCCGAVSAIGFTFYFLQLSLSGGLPGMLIRGILAGILFGIIGGYFIWAFLKLAVIFKNFFRGLPTAINTAGSEQKFTAKMKEYSPEFSYEYFSDKVVSLLKMILFSPSAERLPQYAGEPVGDLFSDIVEASYTGAVALKSFQIKDGCCYVTVDVYMENIYDSGRKPEEKRERIRLSLCKNIQKPIDLHFSVQRIQCKNCGGSFNALRQKNCPYCGTEYKVLDEDWVVTKIRVM